MLFVQLDQLSSFIMGSSNERTVSKRRCTEAAGAATKSSSLTELPLSFRNALQELVGGSGKRTGGVGAEVTYKNAADGRYVLHLTGRWREALGICVRRAGADASAAMFPEGIDEAMQRIKAHHASDADVDAIVVKMQWARDVCEDEEPCHDRVCQRCPRIAPQLLVGLTLSNVRLTCMELLRDCVTLTEIGPETLDAQVHKASVRLVRRMWLDAGVLHCDLHTSNVLISKRTGELRVIDFGMAMRMTDTLKDRLRRAIDDDGDDVGAYDALCKSIVLQELEGRGYCLTGQKGQVWHDDGTFVRLMRSHCENLVAAA